VKKAEGKSTFVSGKKKKKGKIKEGGTRGTMLTPKKRRKKGEGGE